MPNPLPISETFYSIQGEGKLTGTPSFFIRTSGCNLRCTWCDTPYASWNPDGAPRDTDTLLAEALSHPGRHAVLTGGEPMMFPALAPLAAALRDAGFHITIETAGTIPARPDHPIACDLISISPKLANSTPAPGDPRDPNGTWRRLHESRRLDIGALQSLIAAYPNRQLKFVVRELTDLAEIDVLLARLSGWLPADIMLMPEGVTPPTRDAKNWITRECLARGWRYCPRLHLELFGNVRGT